MHSPSPALLGATGNLCRRHIAGQARKRGWPLSVAVRDRRRMERPAPRSRSMIWTRLRWRNEQACGRT